MLEPRLQPAAAWALAECDCSVLRGLCLSGGPALVCEISACAPTLCAALGLGGLYLYPTPLLSPCSRQDSCCHLTPPASQVPREGAVLPPQKVLGLGADLGLSGPCVPSGMWQGTLEEGLPGRDTALSQWLTSVPPLLFQRHWL